MEEENWEENFKEHRDSRPRGKVLPYLTKRSLGFAVYYITR